MGCNCTDKDDEKKFQESVALLKYMIGHNKHHADELYDVANNLDGEAKELVHAAVIDYETGTGKLEKALNVLGSAAGDEDCADCDHTEDCDHHTHD